MKGIWGWWLVSLLALSACSSKHAGGVLVGQLPVVARAVEMDGQPVTVGNMDLLEDTIDLPLS